jgi:hypothetical protein
VYAIEGEIQMTEIPGYKLDHTELLQVTEQTGRINSSLLDAKLRGFKLLQSLSQSLGLTPTYHDEQEMLNLIVETLHHITAAHRCLDTLHAGIEDTFKENDLRCGVDFHSQRDDCGCDTDDNSSPDGTEYYMVQDELWKQARKQPG